MGRTRRRMSETGQDVYLTLGQEIRRARGDRTQTWLAEAIDADQTTVSYYELGKGHISLDELAKIEEALDLGKGELLVRAGIVAPELVPVDTPTVAAIRQDPELDEDEKDIMVGLYENYMRRHPPAPADAAEAS